MSGHYPPPYGYPPPPGPPHYPHGPPPPAYAYIPAPVMMPMPPMPGYHPPPQEPAPQPTYVTNYIYQQPQQPHPDPVQVVDYPAPETRQVLDPIDWVPATPQSAISFAHRAVIAGNEPDGSPLWVIRAHHSGDLLPGKLAIKHKSAYVPYANKEVPIHNFEILCAPAHLVRWLSSSNGQVPAGAIVAGNTINGEPLYVGRTAHKRTITPGKVHPTHGCLYISYGGGEITYKTYEVLCRIE